MARDFDTAMERFRAADSLELYSLEIKWTTLETFDDVLRRLIRALKLRGSFDLHKDVISRARSALYELRKTPIRPSDRILGIESIVEQIMASPHEPVDLWAALVGALNELLASDHPVSDLRTLMQKHDLSRLLEFERLAIVTSTQHRQELKQYLKVRDTSYDLVGLREFKTDGFWDAAVLLGTQQRPYHNFETKEDVAREISWIYFAPAAERLLVVTWSVGQKFELNDYIIRPEITPPAVLSRNTGSVTYWGAPEVRVVRKVRESLAADTDCQVLTIEGPTPPSSGHIGESRRNMTNNVPDSLESVGEWVVAYAKSLPPTARVLVPDDYGLSFETLKDPKDVPLGSILMLREDISAGVQSKDSYDPQRDVVRRAAENLAKNNYASWREVSDRFKQALAQAANDPASPQRLREAGIELPDYYLRIHTSRYYIGPMSIDRYRRLCNALSIPFLESDYAAIAEVRSLHMQAGNTILNLVKKRLESDREWENDCREKNFSVIEDPGFGRVFLSRVLANEVGKCRVSELGQRRWEVAEEAADDEMED